MLLTKRPHKTTANCANGTGAQKENTAQGQKQKRGSNKVERRGWPQEGARGQEEA